MLQFRGHRLRRDHRRCAGVRGHLPRRGPHPGLGHHPSGGHRRGRRLPRRHHLLGRRGPADTPILRDPTTIVDGADYVLMECTYGGREHEPEDEAIRMLAEAVHATRHTAACCSSRRSPSAGRRRSSGTWTGCWTPATSRTCRSTWTRRWRPEASDVYRTIPSYYDDETFALLSVGETAARLPRRDRHRRRPTVQEPSTTRPADDDRVGQRHAHRRPHRAPPARPHRRSRGHPAVRGLPG